MSDILSAIKSKGKLEPIDMAMIFLTQMQTDTPDKTVKEAIANLEEVSARTQPTQEAIRRNAHRPRSNRKDDLRKTRKKLEQSL